MLIRMKSDSIFNMIPKDTETYGFRYPYGVILF